MFTDMIYKRHRNLTEKFLFDYYLISSKREDEVHSMFPFYLDKDIFDNMVKSCEILDNLVRRIVLKLLNEDNIEKIRFDDFPMREEILGLKVPMLPCFWARYDAFEREDGGIFFSEFNYDKPCAQREIVISDVLNPEANPNANFKNAFRDGFRDIWEAYNSKKRNPTIAILIAPDHYDELHLCYLFMDILKPLGYEFQIAGPNNLYVNNEKVYAFDTEIDIILRLYPTEFLYEVKNFEEVVELFNKGKVLIVNDPRVIIAQTKSLFAYLWELVLDNDAFLTEKEISAIKNTIPFTKYFDKECTEELYKDKDKYVIKAAFGRYSEEVYIGKMCDPKEWKEVIDYVLESEKLHIIQEFCPIKNENVLMFENTCYKHQSAFGNFGIYLTNGSFSGVCVRWSPDYLSYDETIWSSPVGIRAESLKICRPSLADRETVWQQINDEALFKWNFTGGFTADYESFTLQSLILPKEVFNELKYATEQFVEIFKKTTRLVQENVGVFGPVLGIEDKLLPLMTQEFTDVLTFIGRLDWVIDTKGKLKLLELNSETPAGLLESMYLNNLILQKTNLLDIYIDPNRSLRDKIKEVFTRIVSDYEKVKKIKNIGFVTNSYYEDWYNTTVLFDLVKDLPYNFVLGEVSGLYAKDNRIYLYDTPLDAMYRYYPLDWFNSDDYFRGVVEGLRYDCHSINPPKTFISQSKALFALVWELVDTDYYSEHEKDIIKRYMPKTALAYEKLGINDFCMKPYFGREGEGLGFSIDESIFSLKGTEYIFQERVDIQTAQLELYSTTSRRRDVCYPLIGTYIVGDRFEGVYTRAGGIVTNKHAVFLPTFTHN